jgi:hypothetical protein
VFLHILFANFYSNCCISSSYFSVLFCRSYSYVHHHLRLPNLFRNLTLFVPQLVSAALPNYVNGKGVKTPDAKRPVSFLLESVLRNVSCPGPRLPSRQMVMMKMTVKNLRRLVKIFDFRCHVIALLSVLKFLPVFTVSFLYDNLHLD